MLYIVLGIVCILGLLFIVHVLKVLQAGKIMKGIEKATLMVRVAAFARLTKSYEPKYGSQARILARAVTNELLSDTSPDDTPAAVFLKNHRDIVEKELSNLANDEELLRIVHITLSQEIGIRHAYGASPEQIQETFNKLKRYGLLTPAKEMTMDEFVNLANAFYDSNKSE